MKKNEVWHCDFCGKDQHEVEKIITGPEGVAICNRCVCQSLEIILDAAKKSAIARVTVVSKSESTIPKGGF
ncbi:ATP-dependent Clp protease ATP-binding subunit ClpX [Serratia entomophila]|uniref:ClpX C4-type zinc finger protein n=1 Tax=Serratia entomophila TaxID=42906 RepID=UPI00217AA423|nr:ClpX C4-type zinc finger protein [Serratia entomophila]CAI1925701.1 ATP-dependent Clp protease ATP-binding subunit ClpX [Serratia entomophila]